MENTLQRFQGFEVKAFCIIRPLKKVDKICKEDLPAKENKENKVEPF